MQLIEDHLEVTGRRENALQFSKRLHYNKTIKSFCITKNFLKIFPTDREIAMAVKLIVSDIDGTLIDSVNLNFDVSPENRAAVQRAAAKGITVALATGRMYKSAARYAQQLGLKESTPVISYNGALIKSLDGTVVSSSCLPGELAVEILEYAFRKSLYIQLYYQDEFHFVAEEERARIYQRATRLPGVAAGEAGLKKLAATGTIPKLLIIAEEGQFTRGIIADLNRDFAGRIVAVQSAERYIDIMLPEVSKGNAVKQLAKLYGCELSEVMCLGDSENDISMLEAAGISVAMGDAAEAVKAAADYVAAPVGENGFAQALEKFVL